MTILVRNEENIIEENILFHKEMGVDGIIITDNCSTDKTRDILDRLKTNGLILEIIDEPDLNFNQYAWVNRMINLASSKYDADWVINSDADEFWYPRNGNLKSVIQKIRRINRIRRFFWIHEINVLYCHLLDMIPIIENNIFWHNTFYVAKTIRNPENYNLSENNIYNAIPFFKVIHKGIGFKSIIQGNHDVEISDKKTKNCTVIIIYHFSIQNYKQFERKIIQGGKAYETNTSLPPQLGYHWKFWYKKYQEGCLPEVYEKLIGKEYFSEFINNGILKEDNTIFSFFNQKSI